LIRFAQAPCGAGKTWGIIRRACELARAGERVLILQPTKELIERTVREELLAQPQPPRHYVFHSDVVGGPVASAITSHFKDAGPGGQIVFATHAVLPFVGFWAGKRDLYLLIDEELQVLSHHQHQIPHTHSVITDHIQLQLHNAIYSRVVVRGMGEFREKGRNRDEDELLGQVAELIKTLTNPHRESLVNTEQYQKLKSGECKRLSVHSLLKPTVLRGFGPVLIAGANFKDTAQYRLWSDRGTRFAEDEEFVAGLRFQSHPNGDLIDIHYATESPWSKKRRGNATADAGQDTNFVRIARAAGGLIGNARFVWQANKDIPDNLFAGTTAERLPNKPHRLNRYADVNNIVVLSALNPAPDHFKFLETLGLTGADVRTATYHSAAYQSVMRTSIREPRNEERKTIVVPDRPLAEYLQERFPGSRVHKLDAGIIEDTIPRKTGRPRKHQSNRERVAEQRARGKEQRLKVLADLLSLTSPHDASEQMGCGYDGGAEPSRNRGELRAEKGIKAITHFGTVLSSASFYRAVTSPTPLGYLEDHGDVDFFVDALKTFHHRQLASKEENYLITPAIFDPGRGIKKRERGNIVYLRHVWLDFENGDLRPDELAALFPNVRLIAVNTFHHRSEKPRFRAIIPTDRPLNPEGHELLFDNVASKIEEAGYWIDRKKKGGNGHAAGKLRAGLDMAMRTPTSLFYLPCQAADPRDSFFIDYNEPGRELLNPIPWIENSVVPMVPADEPPPWPDTPRTKINEGLVQRAISEWRAALPKHGNREFFYLALRLRRAGLSDYEIETMLKTEAAFGRSPKERKGQVKSIMTSLRRSRPR
jgi:hypothetical protein